MSQITGKLFIDGRKLGEGGIGTFIETLVEGLLVNKEIAGITVLASPVYFQRNMKIIDKWKNLGVSVYRDQTPKYSIREMLFLPLRYRTLINKHEWFISPHYTLPFFISIKTAVVIHDLIQFQYPENLFHRFVPPFLIKNAICRADRVLTVAPHIKAQIERFYCRKNIYCVPNSGNPLDSLVPCSFGKKSNNNKLKLLFVGADRYHKRISFFLRFLEVLRVKGVSFHGVLVSKISENTRKEIEDRKLVELVEVLSDIPREDLLNQYDNSDVFISSSIEEGFCIPLLDALGRGVSVLCADREYSRGLAGDSAWFFVPENIDDMFEKFTELVGNEKLREEKRKAGLEISKRYLPSGQAAAFIECLNH
ncbi:MAG TPA: glycosyltransferase [Oligoflexia bacterium]|nr:glycosyltransferase [Oligoflexia bacterium]HMP47097.1 glycosyltransferase [Oligoflexia bacterium]